MPVAVYLKNGEVARVAEATTVEPGNWLGSGGGPSNALACVGDGGGVVAMFRLEDVSGYAIEPARARSRGPVAVRK